MIDPYLFDNQTVFDKIPFENKQRFDYSSDFLKLNNLIKDFNVFNNQNPDQDLNCFTTDQLKKIQNENFKDIEREQNSDNVINKPRKNKPHSFTCRCCKVKEKNYRLFGQFCSEICRQDFVKKKSELAFKKKPSKLAPKTKKKLKIQIKNSSLNYMNENEKSPLTETSDYQQSLKQITSYSQGEAVQESESKAKYYIPKTHCPINGCNGQGHVNGKFTSHYSLSGCPYSQQNQKSSSNTVKEEIPKIIIKKIGDSLFASKKFNLEEKIALINQKKTKKLHKKRGRPAKSQNKTKSASQISQLKQLDKNKASTKFIQGTIQENIFNDQRLILKEKEIKESVYLACSNEMSTSSYERPGFKYDSQLLLGINEYLKNVTDNFRSWRVKDVSGFIKSIPGCSEHAHLFESQEIDGEALLLIQEADLISLMNIKLGPAVKIFNYILKLKQISEQFHKLKKVDA